MTMGIQNLTPEQLENASKEMEELAETERLARECIKKNYKWC